MFTGRSFRTFITRCVRNECGKQDEQKDGQMGSACVKQRTEHTTDEHGQGGHKVGEKNSLSFPGFSRAINLLFHRLSQQKVNVIMTFIMGHSTTTPAI